jgi:uncharacterized membrane protein
MVHIYSQQRPEIEHAERALTRSPDVSARRGFEDVDQWGSLLAGAALAIYGLKRRTLSGIFLAGVGAGLLYRGAKQAGMLDGGLKSLALQTMATKSVDIDKSVTIDRPVEEVYAFWRRLSNLPLFMPHVEHIEELDAHRSIWNVALPSGVSLEWEARILEDRENQSIVWRSMEGADIYNEGFVTFTPTVDGKGTEVHARITYQPPAGAVGKKLAEFFNSIPSEVVKDDLRRFKAILETGEFPTIEGQPAGGRRRNNGQDPRLLH